ncbi:hypothetical protein EVAR_41066_1 [Eumeta japonica]|uniref:Uncharacterized protein n=1 Tax=Eumeta variegata TaxID=151549 RepID=A0A4C1XQY1_EUMVA|nr:hypothetical protein EVAR_41066_1 [Eumeta japonica]
MCFKPLGVMCIRNIEDCVLQVGNQPEHKVDLYLNAHESIIFLPLRNVQRQTKTRMKSYPKNDFKTTSRRQEISSRTHGHTPTRGTKCALNNNPGSIDTKHQPEKKTSLPWLKNKVDFAVSRW